MHWTSMVGIILAGYVVVGTALSVTRATKHKTRYNNTFLNMAKGRPHWVPKDAFVIDLHFHTTYSIDGTLTPGQAVAWCVANGYNGMAITDHNSTAGISEAQHVANAIAPGFVVIPGFEWTTLRFHANVLGVSNCPVSASLIQWPKNEDIAALLAWTHANGGIVQYNHPHDTSCKGISSSDLIDLGFDTVEIVSSSFDLRKGSSPYIKHCCNHNKTGTAGTDTHVPNENKFRVYLEIVGLAPEDKTPLGILNAIKAGRTVIHSGLSNTETRDNSDIGRIGVPKILARIEDVITLPLRILTKQILGKIVF